MKRFWNWLKRIFGFDTPATTPTSGGGGSSIGGGGGTGDGPQSEA